MELPKFTITLSAEAEQAIARLGNPALSMRALATELDRQNQFTIGHISQHRMRGNNGKPFPPEEHVLGIRTNRYRGSLRATRAVVMGESTVHSAIGSNVKYAGIHEFGGTIQRKERAGKVRLLLNKDGSLARQIRGVTKTKTKKGKAKNQYVYWDNLAVFAKRKTKAERVREVAFQGKAYSIKMPARAPVSFGIQDRLPAIGEAISRAIVAAWENGKGATT
jgi:phage gpG-like protein